MPILSSILFFLTECYATRIFWLALPTCLLFSLIPRFK